MQLSLSVQSIKIGFLALGEFGCFLSLKFDTGSDVVFCEQEKIDRARIIRNHGILNRNSIKEFGYVSRMDTLQAAILNYRLKNLNNIINKQYFRFS